MNNVLIRIFNDEEDGLHLEHFEFKLVSLLRNYDQKACWKIKTEHLGSILNQISVENIKRKKGINALSSEQLVEKILKIMREAKWKSPLTELEIVHKVIDKGDV